MITAAVIDRLIHHAEILELNAESYWIKTAKLKQQEVSESNLSNDPEHSDDPERTISHQYNMCALVQYGATPGVPF